MARCMGRVAWWMLLVCAAGSAHAQSGVVGDLLAGKLVKPKVGQWARYVVTDAKEGGKFLVRQAVVGEERIGRGKKGHWVELEVTPQVGFVVIYRMLLTGPANNPKNLRALVFKNGPNPAEHIEINPDDAEEDTPKRKRKSVGLEQVETPSGFIQAERFDVTGDDKTISVWISEDVKPSGVVKMRTPDGEMLLSNYGVGGDFAKTRITEIPVPGALTADEEPNGTEPNVVSTDESEGAEG